jgi:RHS Repeat
LRHSLKLPNLAASQQGRLTERKIISPIVPNPVLATNTYDQSNANFYNIGKLTSSTNAARAQTFDYDANGYLAYNVNGSHAVYNVVSNTGQTLFKYYAPGVVYVGGNDTWNGNFWKSDNFGRLKSIPGMITSQTYEADGQTKAITYANEVTTNFTYSPTRRWVKSIITSKGTVELVASRFTRDAAGRITKVDGNLNGVSTVNDWTYGYDTLDRLITATNAGDATQSETFTYAANDNLLSRSRNPLGASAPAGVAPYVYTYPAGSGLRPHTPTSVAGRAFSYDANGNLTNDQAKQLTWDSANRLASVSRGGKTTSFVCGPDGARASKTTNPSGQARGHASLAHLSPQTITVRRRRE